MELVPGHILTKKSNLTKKCSQVEVMHMLINSDLSDAFKLLTHLSHIVTARPIWLSVEFFTFDILSQHC
jgi:hypothetical protein